MQSDMQHRAKTTTEFFANYIGQSYNAYYQSCVTYARTFEEKNTIELQFINTSGRIVASSYGRWVGPSPTTQDISSAMETRQLATYMGKDPATGSGLWRCPAP